MQPRRADRLMCEQRAPASGRGSPGDGPLRVCAKSETWPDVRGFARRTPGASLLSARSEAEERGPEGTHVFNPVVEMPWT
jgi:hypothetical protein